MAWLFQSAQLTPPQARASSEESAAADASAAAPAEAAAGAGEPAARTEVVAERTESSRVFDNHDGTFTAEVFTEPIHYRSSALQPWTPIDVAFRRDGPSAISSRAPVRVGVNATGVGDPVLSLDTGKHDLQVRLAGAMNVGSGPRIEGNRADYKGVFPNTDLRIFARADGAKAFLILHEPPATPTFTFLVESAALTAERLPDGSIEFADRLGRAAFRMPAPYAVDSSADDHRGGGRFTDAVSFDVAPTTSGTTAIAVRVDPAWLADATYPVFVDPSFGTGTDAYGDAFVSQKYATYNFADYQRADSPYYHELWLGMDPSDSTNVNHIYMKFDLSSIAGQTVDSAYLKFHPYHQYYANDTKTTWIDKVSANWTESGLTWNNRPSSTAYTSVGTIQGQTASAAVTSVVQGWVTTHSTNYGFRLHQNGYGATYWKRVIASEQGGSNVPVLSVTYHRPTAGITEPTSWTNDRTLTWTFSDSSGHAQSHYEVQVSTSSTYSTILTQSGQVASATARTWAVPSTVTLSNGTTYYWRVRVKDGTSWSTWASSSFRWDAASPAFTSSAVGGAITTADPLYYDLGNGSFTVAIRGSDTNSGIKLTYLRLYNATDEMRVQHDWSVSTTHCNEFNTSTLVDATSCSETYNSSGVREVTFTVVGLNSSTSFDIQYYFTDYAGNTLGYVDTGRDLIFDATPPTGSITNPAAGATVGGSVSISGTASDANFKQYVLEYGAGSTPTTWSNIGTNPRTTAVTNGTLGTWDTSALASGTYTIRLRVYDHARVSSGFTEILRTVTVDNSVPTAVISAPANGAFVGGSVNISGTANASFGFTQYTLEYGVGCSPTSWSDIGTNPRLVAVSDGTLGTWETGSLNGSYAIRLVVTKVGGLTNTAVVCVTVDNTAPAATIGSPLADEYVNGSVEIVGRASDANFTSYELEYQAAANPEWKPVGTNPRTVAVSDGTLGTWNTSALTPGVYHIRLRVYDRSHQTTGFGETTRTVVVTDAVHLLPPTMLHADGADLHWSMYDGTAPFHGYQIHRSQTASFAPGEDTLLVTLGDKGRTTFRDTTARPGTAFTYAVLVCTTAACSGPAERLASAGRTVTLPAAGQATLTLQPGPVDGSVTRIHNVGSTCANNGAARTFNVGTQNGIRRGLFWFDLRHIPADATITGATFSYYYEPTSAQVGPVNVHRATAAWEEGAAVAACDGSGATWSDAAGGAALWTNAGGDYVSTATASANPASRSAGGWDNFTITPLVQDWIEGAAPNHGLVVRLATEPTGGAVNYFAVRSDDYGLDATARPKLTVTFTEPVDAEPPVVNVGGAQPGTTVGGTLNLTAGASDDGGLASVEFFVDGASVGVDVEEPYAAAWNTAGASNAAHLITARAVDRAGNATTSPALNIAVDNSAAPTVSLTSPTGGSVSGSAVSLAATAGDDIAVSRVEFYVDDYLIGTDSAAPYTYTWNTLAPDLVTFDGTHVLTARAVDTGGRVTASTPVNVTVANRGGQFFASLNVTNWTVPTRVFEDDLAVDRTERTHPASGTRRTLSSSPTNSQPKSEETTGGECVSGTREQTSATTYAVDVTVANTSPSTKWKPNKLELWYRWYSETGEVVFEGPATTRALPGLDVGQSATRTFTVYPPALCGNEQLADYELRIDVFDTESRTWFAAHGNQPFERTVTVGRRLTGPNAESDTLGLERFYQYWGSDAGAGMSHLVNVANGNALLHWTPMQAPGIGLSTVLNLTYNSLENHSRSPVGNNWSLSLSSLSRFGQPLDIHAQGEGSPAQRWILFTDGDGTTHRFEGRESNGTVYWEEPPGVHLWLREYDASATQPEQRRWALTRPDGVTFFYDTNGYPVAVTDRNGNTLTFDLEPVPPGEDPGGPAWRVKTVKDQGGRSFTITYFGKDDAKRPHIRGNIRRITDHTLSAIEFDYYYDGNLMRIRQVGGTNPDGSALPDRTFVFTYTTPSGDGPAITDANLRVDPDPRTNQSTRVYSVRDPRGKETLFTYNGPGTNLDRWKISGVIDRAGHTTAFSYNRLQNVTTVTAPEGRVTEYLYDATAKVTQITDPLGRLTSLTWNGQFQVERLNEPGDSVREFAYNDNGYVTSLKTCTEGVNAACAITISHTTLTYENLPADRAGSISDPASGTGTRDAAPYWKAGRTIPHVSQLDTKTDPNGNDSDPATTGNYRWLFDYDARGNLTTLTDPMSFATTFTYGANGLRATATDANGSITKYDAYDANGFPELIREGYQPSTDGWLRATRFAYDDDGLLRSVQDPNHFPDTAAPLDATLPAMTRADSAFFEYDPFHRLVRQSAPKSTALERGILIWTAAAYDANDNLTRQVGAHFGTGYSGAGPVTDVAYDAMDRQTLITTPDRSDDPDGERTALVYDAAGRLISVTEPLGVLSPAADDYTTLLTYDKLDRTIRQTRYLIDGTIATEHHTHACYDVAGDLVSVTAPRYGQATINCADSNLTFTTRFEYDDAHRRTAVTDPEGRRTQTFYDANGNVVAARDALGRETTVVFDQRNLPTRVQEPFDRANAAATEDVVTTVFEYDNVGNRTRLVTPRAYDVAGGSGPFDLYSTSYQYDALNRVTRINLPTSGAADDPQLYVHHVYDHNGNPTLVSLPVASTSAPARDAGVSTLTSYWDTGWVESIATPDTTPRTHFDYTAQGRQTLRVPELASGEFNTSEEMLWTYAIDGMLSSRRDIRSDATTYDYDANNRLISAIDATGVSSPGRTAMEILASYDTMNRLTETLQLDSADATHYLVTSFIYDLNSNVHQRVDNGRQPVAGGATDGGRLQTYTYDDAGWMETQIDAGDPGVSDDSTRVRNTFWSTGQERTRIVERGDGTNWSLSQTTSWSWFANGKLDTLEIRNARNEVLEHHEVEYETTSGVYVNGHRIRDTFWLDGPEVPAPAAPAPCQASPGCTATYEYDARDRLIAHNDGHGTATAYTLDAAGNVAAAAETTAGITTETKYRYLGNQLQAVTPPGGSEQRYWYDPRGNLECITVQAGTAGDCALATGGTVSTDVLARYTYDELDRLVRFHSYTISESGVHSADDTARYQYDALDRVVEQSETHSGVTADPRKTLLTYLGLSNLVTEEEHQNSAGIELTTKNYGYDAWGHRITLTEDVTSGAPGDVDPAPEPYTYGHDVHGSVSLLINEASTATASYGYRPYGESDDELTVGDFDPSDPDETKDPTTGDNPLADNPTNAYRYSGRRYDTGSGTVDMGARRFGPAGRFLQRDYLGGALGDLGLSLDPLTQNRYSLAGGNPITFVEWNGHIARPNGGGTAGTGDGSAGKGAGDGFAKGGDYCAETHSCSIDALNERSPEEKLALLQGLAEEYPRLNIDPAWFNNIEGFISYSADQGLLYEDSWSSFVDAGILQSILDGAALAAGRDLPSNRENNAGAIAWRDYFRAQASGVSEYRARELWGPAEQAATYYGVAVADQRRAVPRLAEAFVGIGLGNAYRWGVGHPTATGVGGRAAGWFAGGVGGPGGSHLGSFVGGAVSDWAFDPRTTEVAYWGSTVAYEVVDAVLAPFELFWPDRPGS